MSGKTKTTCAYCARPALYLCDFVIHHATYIEKHAENLDELMHNLTHPVHIEYQTCDRPLCEKHATQKGLMFFDGVKSFVDTVDYCPGHAHGPTHKPPYQPVTGGSAA